MAAWAVPAAVESTVAAWNEVADPELYNRLIADFTTGHGWAGPPVVVDRISNQAVTGSHRIHAARAADIPVPVVYLDDLFEAHGLDWDAWLDEHDGELYEAVRMLNYAGLPDEVSDYLGFDID